MAKLPFEGEIRKMLEGMYPLVGRSPDVRGQRFSSPKKFDFWCCSESGQFVAIECKAIRLSKTFPFSSIPIHQREALSIVANTGGQAFLALNIRGQNNPGHAWLIPWGWFLDFERLWPKKSIRLTEAIVEFSGFALVRIPSGWNESRQLRFE